MNEIHNDTELSFTNIKNTFEFSQKWFKIKTSSSVRESDVDLVAIQLDSMSLFSECLVKVIQTNNVSLFVLFSKITISFHKRVISSSIKLHWFHVMVVFISE